MNPIAAASKKYEELFTGWFKNLLGISSGALAVLVSLMPQGEIPSPDKYPLAICWVFFAVSIICALVASFREVNIAQLELHVLGELQNQPANLEQLTIPKNRKTEFLKWRMRAISVCQFLAVASFVMAFVCLASYAYLRTI